MRYGAAAIDLACGPAAAHIAAVEKAQEELPARNRFGLRFVLTVIGGLLILASPVVGAIPGPGGLFVFAAGLALMLKNSVWAKRFYVRLKRKHPRKGAWADWAMRRASALRRAERPSDSTRAD